MHRLAGHEYIVGGDVDHAVLEAAQREISQRRLEITIVGQRIAEQLERRATHEHTVDPARMIRG